MPAVKCCVFQQLWDPPRTEYPGFATILTEKVKLATCCSMLGYDGWTPARTKKERAGPFGSLNSGLPTLSFRVEKDQSARCTWQDVELLRSSQTLPLSHLFRSDCSRLLRVGAGIVEKTIQDQVPLLGPRKRAFFRYRRVGLPCLDLCLVTRPGRSVRKARNVCVMQDLPCFWSLLGVS